MRFQLLHSIVVALRPMPVNNPRQRANRSYLTPIYASQHAQVGMDACECRDEGKPDREHSEAS